MKNQNLHKAKSAKNDEFYTQMKDIEKEIGNYDKDTFRDMVVYCNCDSYKSNFWQYFVREFNNLGLKKLIATSFNAYGSGVKMEYNGCTTVTSNLIWNGDFRSGECTELLAECDIVCTNPPFSLFRDFVSLLIEYNKKFLVIGNNNAITYKEIFKLIKDNLLWLGVSPRSMIFRMPDGSETNVNACWFTNLYHQKRNKKIILFREYNPELYPKYDNYDAIEVSKVADIPMDYYKVMGVPITFLDKFNPEQFEIVGQMVTTQVDEFNHGYPYVNGCKIYARILIKHKHTRDVF